MNAARLLDLLAARTGLICAVGAGGKKSTLYRLVEAHLAVGTRRIALTSTVQSALPPDALATAPLVAEADELARRVPQLAAARRLLVFGRPGRKPDRLAGLAPELVAGLVAAGGFEVGLVKADGARMRWVKAPGAGEPVLPPGVTTVLSILSARAIGRPLDARIGHRLAEVQAASGAAPGEMLTAAHLGRLLASPAGVVGRVGDGVTVVPILNMVDDAPILAGARAAAHTALALCPRFERVVLATMAAPEPIVEVVER